jgi:hypothetical protein
MFHFYKLILLILMFVISYGIVSWRNSFNNVWETTLRIIISILAIWGYVVLSRYIVVNADLALATNQDEIRLIANGDGAKNVFALLFGWVPGIIVTLMVLAVTAINRWVRNLFRRKSGNCA